jgi:hypothetical protein
MSLVQKRRQVIDVDRFDSIDLQVQLLEKGWQVTVVLGLDPIYLLAMLNETSHLNDPSIRFRLCVAAVAAKFHDAPFLRRGLRQRSSQHYNRQQQFRHHRIRPPFDG